MNRKRISFVLISLIVGTVLGCGIGYAIYQPQIFRFQSDISKLQSSIENLTERLDQLTQLLNMNVLLRNSYKCVGDIDKLITPCSNALDGIWSTKVEWNTTHLGDFNVSIIENFTVPSSANIVKWEFRAYHKRKGSLMPTPMEISYWYGYSWKQLYALDDEDYVNEVFIETLDMPAEALSEQNKISIKTTIKYSSHLVGAIPPSLPEQLWHYTEYFEGKMTYTKTPIQ